MTPIKAFDIIYISYDEPNAEFNWANIFNLAPWAKRVHGITGLDNVHRAAAEKATTDWFITVDGDNIVYPSFFNISVDMTDFNERTSISWSGKNNVNGLVYGNGGLKLWSREFAGNMNHHIDGVDFCWDKDYKAVDGVYSESIINGSQFQAFRAGFREGVKLSLDQGRKIPARKFKIRNDKENLRRLLIWCSIGLDIEFGEFAIYGARLGCKMSTLEEWDFKVISDYNWVKEFWDSNNVSKDMLKNMINIGEELKENLHIDIADFTIKQSKMFKSVCLYNPVRPK